jgi:hypothetical protein
MEGENIKAAEKVQYIKLYPNIWDYCNHATNCTAQMSLILRQMLSPASTPDWGHIARIDGHRGGVVARNGQIGEKPGRSLVISYIEMKFYILN